MRVEDLIIFGKKHISSTETKMLLATVLECDYLEILNRLDEVVDNESIEKFKMFIESRKNNIPVQYITNEARFYKMDLYVNENVLIPRFETEELVDYSLSFIKDKFINPKVLDLCCGSGAIGLAIKNNIVSEVTLSDISIKALEVAKFNSEKLNLDVDIINSDLFSNIEKKFDVIICNPPYIGTEEEVDSLVLNNEPHLALFAKDNGLFFYDKILSEISNYLNNNFLIAFEIGSNQNESVKELINKYMSDVKIISKKDLQGRDRMLFIYR